jgi:hypothetical protein
VSGNSASSEGGGLESRGNILLTNVTVSGNTGAFGAGILSFTNTGVLTIANSTIAGNNGIGIQLSASGLRR